MNKKLIILIILILAIVGFASFYIFSNQEHSIKVGESTFIMPKGYHLGSPNELGGTNLTNNTNEIYIDMYDSQNVTKYIEEYMNYSTKNNNTVKFSNFTIGDTFIYKSNIIDGRDSVHFWFVKDKKVYTIYCWDKNPKIDSIAVNLIESMK